MGPVQICVSSRVIPGLNRGTCMLRVSTPVYTCECLGEVTSFLTPPSV